MRGNLPENEAGIRWDQLAIDVFEGYAQEDIELRLEEQHMQYDLNADHVQIPIIDVALARFKSIWTIFYGQPTCVNAFPHWMRPKGKNYHYYALEVLKRVAGVILRHINYPDLKCRFMFKEEIRKKYQIKKLSPIYPERKYSPEIIDRCCSQETPRNK